MTIQIVKAKTTMEVEIDNLPEETYAEALRRGLKDILNSEQTKFTKKDYPNAEELQAASLAKAQEQLEKAYAGTIRMSGQPRKAKVAGKVMIEARRRAKSFVKDTLRRDGVKVSYVEPRAITQAANDYLETEEGLGLIAKVQAEMEALDKAPPKVNISKVQVSAKRKAEAEKKKTEATARAAVSAAQAGRVQARQRPGQSPS
jgi:hypothetical protein